MAILLGCNTKAMVTALDSTIMDFIPKVLDVVLSQQEERQHNLLHDKF